jgi:hypothetical protein
MNIRHENMTRTHHFPLTLIKQVISGSSPPSFKADPNGSRISNLALEGEIAISVSGTGLGEGLGASERSPGVKPALGSLSPEGGENRNGPLGVSMLSVVGLKLRSPENAIWSRQTSAIMRDE